MKHEGEVVKVWTEERRPTAEAHWREHACSREERRDKGRAAAAAAGEEAKMKKRVKRKGRKEGTQEQAIGNSFSRIPVFKLI